MRPPARSEFPFSIYLGWLLIVVEPVYAPLLALKLTFAVNRAVEPAHPPKPRVTAPVALAPAAMLPIVTGNVETAEAAGEQGVPATCVRVTPVI